MSRLTISISDDMHRALKEAAVRQGRSIGSIIEEGLQLRGIKPIEDARSLVEKARAQAALTELEALDISTEETRAQRHS
jgi:predicted CopG family antitoxin